MIAGCGCAWDLFAEAADAADEVLDAMAVPIAKGLPDPLDPEGFDYFVRRVLRGLRGAARGQERAAVRQALAVLDVRWTELSPAQRERAIRSAARIVAGTSKFVAPRVDAVVRREAPTLYGRARTATASKFKLQISGATSGVDQRMVRFLSRSQGNYVRDEFWRRSVRGSEVARRVVARGFERGFDNATIGQALSKEMRRIGIEQSDRYWQIVSSVFCQRARSYGEIASMADAGIRLYRWTSVMDERTCFAAGTRVRLPDGSTIQIERVRAGDVVVSCRGRARRVLATRASPRRDWIRIETADGRVLDVTPNHPMLTSGGWCRARDIAEGADLVLFRSRGPGEASELWDDSVVPRMRDVVPAHSVAAPLLLGELSLTGTDVRELRRDLPAAPDLSPTQPGSILRRAVLAPEPDRSSRSGIVDAQVLPLRNRVPGAAGRGLEAAVAVLEGVSTATGSARVRDLRRFLRAEGERDLRQVLLALLLSTARRRVEPGADRSLGAGSSCDPVRARGACRQVVDRLPCGGPRRGRGRRLLLALVAGDEAARCEAGRGAVCAGADRDPSRRERGPVGPALRPASVDRLWPRPRGDLGAVAATTRVVRVSSRILKLPAPAYDLEIEDDAGFVAEGVIVHNTEECRFMDGQVLTIDGALRNIAAAEKATEKDPEAIRDVAPFVRSGKDDDGNRILYVTRGGERDVLARVERPAVGEKDQRGIYSNAVDSAGLEARGVSLPPIHELCRSTILPEL